MTANVDVIVAAGPTLDAVRHVTSKVPVAWIYLTAWMNRDQTVHFRNDVYAQDEHLLEMIVELCGQSFTFPLFREIELRRKRPQTVM